MLQVLEGEYKLTDLVIPPNQQHMLVTVTFVPGREVVESLITHEDDGRDGYQWFSLRVEIDDADGELNEEHISANSFPEFMMALPEKDYFDPVSAPDSREEDDPEDLSEADREELEQREIQKTNKKPEKKSFFRLHSKYPGEKLKLPQQTTMVKVQIHHPDDTPGAILSSMGVKSLSSLPFSGSKRKDKKDKGEQGDKKSYQIVGVQPMKRSVEQASEGASVENPVSMIIHEV